MFEEIVALRTKTGDFYLPGSTATPPFTDPDLRLRVDHIVRTAKSDFDYAPLEPPKEEDKVRQIVQQTIAQTALAEKPAEPDGDMDGGMSDDIPDDALMVEEPFEFFVLMRPEGNKTSPVVVRVIKDEDVSFYDFVTPPERIVCFLAGVAQRFEGTDNLLETSDGSAGE